MNFLRISVVVLISMVTAASADEPSQSTDESFSVWPQGCGPNGNFSVAATTSPKSWSVVWDKNIAWKKTLPETGQSTVTIWKDRIFFTTLAEVEKDSTLGKDIVAWCCDANTGEALWTRTINADHPLRLSGCFSDSSAPPALTDGRRVVFFNSSGKIACFDFDGELLWELAAMPVGRSQPFLIGGNVVYTRQSYMPDENGHFSHEHADEPVDRWTQLQTLDMETGKTQWTTTCGVNMGSVPLPQSLPDGRWVIVVGRGGGHSPPEKPEGISMVDATDGTTIWTRPLDGFMSTMTMSIRDGWVFAFHDNEHLWIEGKTGTIKRRVNFLENVDVRRHDSTRWGTVTETLAPPKKKRAIIQQSNLLVGRYHFFRSYSRPYIGRVNVETGRVEYLQLPVQLKRERLTDNDQLLWGPSQMEPEIVEQIKSSLRKRPKSLGIERWCFTPNDMLNSRGFEVVGDDRSRGTGWGHHASQVPICVGNLLYVPIMNGTVYVLNAMAQTWDENAIVAINDLGPVGRSFNRASLSFADGRLYAHTIRELICIGGP